MSNQLPDGWIISPLEHVIKQIIDFRGRTPKKLGMEWGGGSIRALSANNVQMGKVNFQKECYLASDELYQKWMTKGDTEKGDVLFTMEAPLGNVALVPDNDKYILSQRVILLKNNRDRVSSDFLFQQLRSDNFQNILRENATGSTALGIQQKKLVTLDLVLPPLPEQQKIAAILTSVDDVIEKTQAQINKLKDLKTGMMQELLTRGVGVDGKPHTEFKDSPVGRIPKGWDVWTLDDMSEKRKPVLKTGPFGSSLKSSDFKEKGVPVINIQNLGVGKLETKNIYFVTNEKASELSGYSVSEGDLVFSRVADVGRSVVIPKEAIGWIMSSNLMRISTDKSKVDSKYLMYQLVNGPSVTLQLNQMVSDGGRQVVTGPTIKQLQFPIPSITEQKMIVNKIDSIDYYLNEKVNKVAQLNAIKKALMQDLLTGKVRVNVE
ncbi:restriction endonuclease subunit S [Photobacterium damselae]